MILLLTLSKSGPTQLPKWAQFCHKGLSLLSTAVSVSELGVMIALSLMTDLPVPCVQPEPNSILGVSCCLRFSS